MSDKLQKQNSRWAQRRWPAGMSSELIQQLREITAKCRLSGAAGDIVLLGGKWYVTHAGLLKIAQRQHCFGIDACVITRVSEPRNHQWVVKATVYRSAECRGFVGYGDADPTNTSDLIRGAELRIAETRAVNRALRKAYAIGVCSVEELGSGQPDPPPPAACVRLIPKAEKNGDGDSPSVRDQLRFLIRQHELDPGQVKAYAADCCGVTELKKVTREKLVEFVRHLENYATHDRESLVEQLKSYASASGKEGAA